MKNVLVGAFQSLVHLTSELAAFHRNPPERRLLKQWFVPVSALATAAVAWDVAVDLLLRHLPHGSLTVGFTGWIVAGVGMLFAGGQALFGWALIRLVEKQDLLRLRNGSDNAAVILVVYATLIVGFFLALKDLLVWHGFASGEFSVFRVTLFALSLLQSALFQAALALATWYAWTFFKKTNKIGFMIQVLVAIQIAVFSVTFFARFLSNSRILSWAKNQGWGVHWNGSMWFQFERVVHSNLTNPILESCIYLILIGYLVRHIEQRCQSRLTESSTAPAIQPAPLAGPLPPPPPLPPPLPNAEGRPKECAAQELRTQPESNSPKT